MTIVDNISEIQEILQMARSIKSKSDMNKAWVYVGFGVLGHRVAKSTGACIPLRDQINKQLKMVNARHAQVGVRWLYEKETLVVTFL